MKKVKTGLQLLLAGVLLFSAIPIVWAQGEASSKPLGIAQDFNIFLLEDIEQTSDTEGRLAAGGNAILNNFGVGDKLDSSANGTDVFVVGGDVTYGNGQIFYGNAVYGGALNVSSPYNPNVRYGSWR